MKIESMVNVIAPGARTVSVTARRINITNVNAVAKGTGVNTRAQRAVSMAVSALITGASLNAEGEILKPLNPTSRKTNIVP